MDNLNEQAVFAKLTSFIVDVLGEDVAEFVEISESSRFVQDLEMDSIQIIAFAEMVKKEYDMNKKFVEWIAKKSMKKIINMSVGDVVTFIIDHQ
ncbi:acyl carrier protein [Listeria sp. PSOL-1]|uniref:acyl carrier protein n=1 Tax=Listeria sp. PSOL-1 TaxID=1844999 RepID=UPI0013D4CD60|nr:acyl carrier protein [Listeria sp. PSOL-1]